MAESKPSTKPIAYAFLLKTIVPWPTKFKNWNAEFDHDFSGQVQSKCGALWGTFRCIHSTIAYFKVI